MSLEKRLRQIKKKEAERISVRLENSSEHLKQVYLGAYADGMLYLNNVYDAVRDNLPGS